MKRTLLVLTASAFALLATACNTVEGFGQDVEATGDKIEETADANKPE